MKKRHPALAQCFARLWRDVEGLPLAETSLSQQVETIISKIGDSLWKSFDPKFMEFACDLYESIGKINSSEFINPFKAQDEGEIERSSMKKLWESVLMQDPALVAISPIWHSVADLTAFLQMRGILLLQYDKYTDTDTNTNTDADTNTDANTSPRVLALLVLILILLIMLIVTSTVLHYTIPYYTIL